MDLDCPHLSLAPHWVGAHDPRRIVLVPGLDALRLSRTGEYETVAPWETVWQMISAGRSLSDQVGDFLLRNSRLGPDPRCLRDDELTAWAAQAIAHGDFVGLRPAGQQLEDDDDAADQRRLARAVARATRGRLNHGGRRYQLVAGADEGGIAERERYQVVGHADAVRVLSAIAEESASRAELATLLAEAGAKLSADWRPPLRPSGLVLLRRVVPRAVASQPAAAITPSQMRAMIGNASLDIHVVDTKGKPKEGLGFAIQTPDGGTVQGALDPHGHAQAQSSTPGLFTVSFPELDGADWTGDGALAIADDQRTEESRHQVEQGDRLATIARAHGFIRGQTLWDFSGNAALKALRGTGHVLKPGDQVSIPTKLQRTAEVPAGTAKYVVESGAEVLRVRFAGLASTVDEPISFKATPDTGAPVEGPLGADGWIEVDLPCGTGKVTVELFCDDGEDDGGEGQSEPFATYALSVGELDPLKELSGIQARLFNLGFYDGAITGTLDDDTRAAISHFRWAKLQDGRSEIDDDFLKALRQAYGV